MENVEWLVSLRTVLELGWPAIVMLAVTLLWRHHVAETRAWRGEYIELQREYVGALREVAGLRAALPPRPPTLPEEQAIRTARGE